MKTFAKIISLVFHPIFVPLYMLAVSLMLPVYAFQRYTPTLKLYIISYIFLLDVLLPITSLLLMKRYGLISSMKIEKAEERTIPYWMMFFMYSVTAYTMGNVAGFHPILPFAFILSAIIIIVMIFINRYMKISAHAISMAAAATWFYLLFKAFGYNTSLFIIITVLLLGMVMSARLQLKAHTPAEVYSGAVAGVLLSLVFGSIFVY